MEKLGGCPCKKKLKELLKVGLGCYEDEGLGTPSFTQKTNEEFKKYIDSNLVQFRIIDKNFYPIKGIKFIEKIRRVNTEEGKVLTYHFSAETDSEGYVSLPVMLYGKMRMIIPKTDNEEYLNPSVRKRYRGLKFSDRPSNILQLTGIEVNTKTGIPSKIEHIYGEWLFRDVAEKAIIFDLEPDKNTDTGNKNLVDTNAGDKENKNKSNLPEVGNQGNGDDDDKEDEVSYTVPLIITGVALTILLIGTKKIIL